MTTTAHQQGSWETLTAALEQKMGPGKPAGEWVKYCCPVHEADSGRHNPSLGIKYLSDAQRTKVRCFAGCDDVQILDTLGLKVRDLYDTPITRSSGGGRRTAPRVRPRQITRADRAIDAAGLPLAQPKKDLGQQVSAWTQVATYPYMRENGEVAGEILRKEARFEHGHNKRFTQQRWDPQTGWQPEGFEPLPFQLPQLLAAIEAGESVYVCEGEKDVLTAEKAGLAATTNAGGAGSWTPEHARWLRGAAEVVIVVDRDAPGYRRADKVMTSLKGLGIGQVRVVQAATGKDLTDHINAGHAIDELDPVPFLDPLTGAHTEAAPARSAEQLANSAGVVSPAQLMAEPTTQFTPTDGGNSMSQSGFFQDVPPQHDDTVDRYGQHFSRLAQQVLQTMIAFAQLMAERRRQEEIAATKSQEAQREYEARIAIEQKAVETRLAKMSEEGWDRFSRSEIAAAVRDATAWSDQSDAARSAMHDLSGHVQQRYGVYIDPDGGHVTVDAPELSQQLAKVERDRASVNRVHTAEDRMVSIVAADPGIAESAKRGLYEDINSWGRQPSGRGLEALSKKVTAAGLNEKDRNKIRFIAVYIGVPGGRNALMPIDDLGAVAALSATNELRKTAQPLVDPAEEIKPRIDDMLTKYQDRLRHSVDVTSVTEALTAAVNLLPEDEQALARQRGKDIRADPSIEHKKLWPDHVDRDQLDVVVRTYAAMAPQVEAMAVQDSVLGPDGQAEGAGAERLRTQAAKHRRSIEHTIANGKGLHPLEVDQLRAVLADIDAGITDVPEQLFADDRSAAALDAERSDQIAHDTAAYHRRQLDEILSTGAVPADTARHANAEIASVFDAQTQLAAGRTSLGDYEERGADGKLLAHLAAAGIPEGVHNRVKHHIDHAAGESAIAGKQARRIQNQWTDRRELVAANRTPEPVPYDSTARREATEARLRAAGLSERVITGRMAVDAGHATPPQDAVKATPGKQKRARTTAPGSGVYRSTHRGRGDQRGYGK